MKTAAVAWTSLALSALSLAMATWLVFDRKDQPSPFQGGVMHPAELRVASAQLERAPKEASGGPRSDDQAAARRLANTLGIDSTKTAMFESIVIDHMERVRRSSSEAQRVASVLSTEATLEANFDTQLAKAAMAKI